MLCWRSTSRHRCLFNLGNGLKIVGLRRHSLEKKTTPAFMEMILCRLRAERYNLGFMAIRQSLALEMNKANDTLRCFMLFSFHS